MTGTNQILGGGGFHHVAVRVKDFDAAVRFYTEVLGLRATRGWGEGDSRAVLMDTGDGSFLEVFADGKSTDGSEAPLMHIALNCKDVDGVTENARRAGSQVTVEPKDAEIPSDPPLPVRISFFRDPGGELIELFCQRKA
ncbi:MAG TPA: VOC family protein [Phycisphaerales bacterium]|nr:VOC family protein [Phycisphaerales bacterium]